MKKFLKKRKLVKIQLGSNENKEETKVSLFRELPETGKHAVKIRAYTTRTNAQYEPPHRAGCVKASNSDHREIVSRKKKLRPRRRVQRYQLSHAALRICQFLTPKKKKKKPVRPTYITTFTYGTTKIFN